MDDALILDDGVDLIVEERDRCWEVTQDQDRASKIEEALFETQRDEKVAESSHDKVVMWTGGSYDYHDVVRAPVRLDRPEMRPGTSGQSGKTIPTYFIDPELDAPTIVPGSEIWTQPRLDRSHWDEVLNALQEDASARTERRQAHVMERSPSREFSILPTRAWGKLKRMRYRRYYLHARPAFQHRGYRAIREDLNAAQKSRGFFGPRRGASGRAQGPRMKRSSIHQLKLRMRCARCRKLGHWGSRVSRRESRTTQRRKVPSTCGET